jgi:uncharacterized protein YbbC (DUF1343 family)
MLDSGSESFVAFHSMPVRHAMTIGEIAQMIKAERKLTNLKLEIIACQGWSRGQTYDQTGLTWINPSPNMRSLTQALLYPGVGLLETTNLSVGRGTDTPFEVVGAPWIDERRWCARLQQLRLPGATFVPIEFVPQSSKFANENCHGINLLITDRKSFQPVHLGLALACTLRELFPDKWDTKSLNRLMGNKACQQAIVDGQPLDQVLEISRTGVADFLRRRDAFLLYR